MKRCSVNIYKLLLSDDMHGYIVRFATKIVGYLFGEFTTLSDGRNVYYLSYIYNADMDGLTEEEREHIDTVLNGYGWLEAVNIDSPFFSYQNSFNSLGSECVILNAYK